LESLYGLDFESFIPLDSGGPATVAALRDGEVDVAVLFTTNPAIDVNDFVVLRDNKDLQPAENIVPVIRDEVVDRFGSRLTDRLDEVTSKLTSGVLRRLNARAEIDHVPAEEVAADWLTEEGLL
jgi:osmoprotectant transport system substrate-binding protein